MLAMKLSTTLGHIDNIPNSINASLVKDFYEYLKEIGTSENYQNQNIKQLIGFAKSLGSERTFYDTHTKDGIPSSSSVWSYIKNKNKKFITVTDLEQS